MTYPRPAVGHTATFIQGYAMIRFRCHRCKRPIAAPDGHVGKKVKCPGCMIVTIVPDIPGAQAAKERALKPPRSATTPPSPQGPPDPLDELAAAIDGEVQTATFDDGYTAYEQVDSFDDAQPAFPDYDPSQQRPRRRREPKRKPYASLDPLDTFICVLFPTIGFFLGLARSRTNRKAGSQMVGISVFMHVLGVVIYLLIKVVSGTAP
jgi:hypothetical protein